MTMQSTLKGKKLRSGLIFKKKKKIKSLFKLMLISIKKAVVLKSLKRQPHKIVKHAQTIRRQIAEFECV